jgi:hypothetical protein
VSPFRPFLLPEPSVFPRSVDFYRPLFSCSYKSLFTQTLSFHIHTKRRGVGPSPFLLPDSLPCERANAPFNKYLWNEHLQKCVKTKDFNYLQNQHLRKIRGRGPVSPATACFSRRYRLNLSMLASAASHAPRAFAPRSGPLYPRSSGLTTRFP